MRAKHLCRCECCDAIFEAYWDGARFCSSPCRRDALSVFSPFGDSSPDDEAWLEVVPDDFRDSPR